LENEVTGNLEQEVAEEEDAGAKAVHGVAKGQCLLHLQLRVADIDAVEEGDHVGDQQQRNEPPADLRIHRFNRVGAGRQRSINRCGCCAHGGPPFC
jgi:hypothetical protein